MAISEIPGAAKVGLTLIEKVFSWWTDEAGRIEIRKRARIREKKEECQRALKDKQYTNLARLSAELERLSNEA